MFTALATLGLAISSVVPEPKISWNLKSMKVSVRFRRLPKPKVWLHWTLFPFGSLGAIDTLLVMNGNDDGLGLNWFVGGLINVFGPFMLWIGGVLILGKLGAAGPRIMQFFFSRSPLLSDVKQVSREVVRQSP